jgi:nucleoside-diphosphate-sugar epimerase
VQDDILVTGGAGFIGSHLVERLGAEGARVRVIDNFATGRRSNLAGFAAEVLEGDVRDLDAVRRAVAGCRFVVHLAALGSVPRSVEDPLTSHEVNATGTLNVLLASRDAGVERLVYASSSSVYGESRELPKRESFGVDPRSPYALAKYTGEALCGIFSRLYGFQAVALRYFNVFGPRQDPSSAYAAVIPRFVSAALRGEAAVVYGDGGQTRDFTYVANVVEANLRALAAPSAVALEAGGGVYNVACGSRVSLLELLAEINRAVGSDAAPHFEPARLGDVRDSLAALDLAREYLGYEPSVDLREGIRRTVAWFREVGAGQRD